MARYDIYEKDGALFRGRSGSHFVTEIQVGDGWKPYDGAPCAPVTFGDYMRTEDETGADLGGYNNPSRLASAMSYVALIHGAQKRKGTAIPYVSHLMSVSALIMENGGDEDQAIAGLLHDAVEDCGAHHENVSHPTRQL